MMELGITQPTNIHNTRSLIHTLKYVLDILQTEETFTVKECELLDFFPTQIWTGSTQSAFIY